MTTKDVPPIPEPVEPITKNPSEVKYIGNNFEGRFQEATKGSDELSIRRIMSKITYAIALLKDPENAKALCVDVLNHVRETKPRNAIELEIIRRTVDAILISYATKGYVGVPSVPLFKNGSAVIAWLNLDHVAENFKDALEKSPLKENKEVSDAVNNLMTAAINRDVVSYKTHLEFLLPYEKILEMRDTGKVRSSINIIETTRID